MRNALGIIRATLSQSTDPRDPFVFHIHGLLKNGDTVLVATIHDEFPSLTRRILKMLQDRGVSVEEIALPIESNEPDVQFMGMRDSIDEDGKEWIGLETRFVDGQKIQAACFSAEYEDFAEEMTRIYPRP